MRAARGRSGSATASPRLQIRGAPRPRVTGDRVRGVLDADRHRQVGERGQVEVDRVRDHRRTRRDRHRRPPAEREGLAALGPDRGAAGGRGHVRREDRQGLRPEGVGEPDSQAPPAQRDVDDLSERGVGQARRGRHVGRLGPLGRGRPRPHPATFVAPRTAPARATSARARRPAGRRRVMRFVIGGLPRSLTARSRSSPGHP